MAQNSDRQGGESAVGQPEELGALEVLAISRRVAVEAALTGFAIYAGRAPAVEESADLAETALEDWDAELELGRRQAHSPRMVERSLIEEGGRGSIDVCTTCQVLHPCEVWRALDVLEAGAA